MGEERDTSEISLRLLEIFATMMRAATTIEAAELLHISQPAVSAALKQLEANLGLVLFERTSRRLVPTHEAQMLFEDIQPIFGQMRAIAQRAQLMRKGLVGRLRVFSTHPLGNTVLPLALRRFLDDRPDLSISFDVRRLDQVLEAVQNGVIDVGFALVNRSLEQVGIEVLHRAKMVAMIPQDDPLSAHDSVTARDISDRRLVGLEQESELGSLLRKGFQQFGVAYRPRIETRLCQTAALLAQYGLGSAVVDPWSARVYPSQGLTIRPFVPALEVRAVALFRRGIPQSQISRQFVTEVRSCLREMSDQPLPGSV